VVHLYFLFQAKTTLLVVGISLAFGALFAKTWRVHVIFTNTSLQRKVTIMMFF
jgi:gamma-aminobutyric acid type B receptor